MPGANTVHIAGRVWWYANCGFSHRCSVSFGQERSPKSAPAQALTMCASNKIRKYGNKYSLKRFAKI